MTGPVSPPTLEFHRRESVRSGLRRLRSILVDAARLQATRPSAERNLAVHEMRRIIKRLRALVRMLRPTIGRTLARQQNRRLQIAARKLAQARDAAVGILTLEALARNTDENSATAVAEVRQRFARVARVRHLRPAVIASALTDAADVVARASASLDRVNWKGSGWTTLEAGLRAGYRRAQRRARAAHTTRDEAKFHAWRTATKSLFYQAALLGPMRPVRLRALLEALDTLQDQLGLEHDLAVLRTWIEERPKVFGSTAAITRTLELIASRQQALRKDCLRRGRRLFASAPSRFVALLAADWRRWRGRR